MQHMYYLLLLLVALDLAFIVLWLFRSKSSTHYEGIKTVVQFSAPFEYPILEEGPSCLQERLLEPALWLHRILQEHIPGIAAPDFVDYGYSMNCSTRSREYCIELSFDFYNWQYYEVSIETSFKRSGCRRRFNEKNEQSELATIATAIHRSLSQQSEVTDIRWYDFAPEGKGLPYAERPD